MAAASLPSRAVTTLEAKVQEVPLVLSVTDHKGKYVDGLTESDLQIFDNNLEQKAITFFEHQTNLPLNVAIVVDMSSSVAHRFLAEQRSIKSFIHTVARPTDQVRIFAFNQNVQMMGEVHNNWKDIAHRFKKLKPKGNTALFDALVQAADSIENSDTPSRRILIVITDGEENDSAFSLQSSIAHALKAECAIYAVNVSSETADEDARRGQAILKQMAEATGGTYLHADIDGDLTVALGKIRRELRSQYAIAYRPSGLVQGTFHRVHVLARKKLNVRCRSGYYVR